MSAALRARGLTKRYNDLAVVQGLDLDVERGQLYGFLGPNGAGKTTTIRMLLGLVHPSEGMAEMLGERVVSDGRTQAGAGARRALRRTGAIIEEPAFWRYLSGRRNLEYLARASGPAAERRDRLARVDEVLRLVGLAQAADKGVRAYSQGMRQRLGIAQALLGAPEMLILDEPTNGLDPQGMREMRMLMRRLADSGTTVFVSSHLLAEVEAMCDRVGVLAQGRLVAEGPPSRLRPSATSLRVEVDDLARARAALTGVPGVSEAPGSALVGGPDRDRPPGPDRADIPTGSDPGPSQTAATAGSLWLRLAPPAAPAAVNAVLVAAGVAVSALVPEHERLEDVFIELVGDADVPR